MKKKLTAEQKRGVQQEVDGQLRDAAIQAFIKSLPVEERMEIAGRVDGLNIENKRLRRKVVLCFSDIYFLGMEAAARGEKAEVWREKFTAEFDKV